MWNGRIPSLGGMRRACASGAKDDSDYLHVLTGATVRDVRDTVPKRALAVSVSGRGVLGPVLGGCAQPVDVPLAHADPLGCLGYL